MTCSLGKLLDPNHETTSSAAGPGMHDLTRDLAVIPACVAGEADLFRQIEHDRRRQSMVAAGQIDEVLPVLRTHVGRIDTVNGAAPTVSRQWRNQSKAPVSHSGRSRRRRPGATMVRGNYLGRRKMAGGESRLAGTAVAPTSTTSEKSGSSLPCEDTHLRRRTKLRVRLADLINPRRCIRIARPSFQAQSLNAARDHSKR